MAKPKTKNKKISRHADRSKAKAYAALAAFNRDIDLLLEDLERLGSLGLLLHRGERQFFRVCRATLEETRAWTNFELVDVLGQKEEREWVRFARIRGRVEKQSEPPGDAIRLLKPRR